MKTLITLLAMSLFGSVVSAQSTTKPPKVKQDLADLPDTIRIKSVRPNGRADEDISVDSIYQATKLKRLQDWGYEFGWMEVSSKEGDILYTIKVPGGDYQKRALYVLLLEEVWIRKQK